MKDVEQIMELLTLIEEENHDHAMNLIREICGQSYWDGLNSAQEAAIKGVKKFVKGLNNGK